MADLSGKVAFVLGAAGAGNMGQTIARRLAADGAKVTVAGRHEQVLSALAKEIGGDFAICDITDGAALRNAIDAAVKKHGRLDIGVNATGLALGSAFTETSEADLDRMYAVQFKGPYQFMQALVRAMTHGGSIIQISSATATIMVDDYAAYQGTKAGIDHVVRCIANQYGARGIRANSVSPGITATPMAAEAFKLPGLVECFRKEYPMGRIGTSQDIAAAVAWLASDECFLTGQNLQVNGGLTLRRNPTSAEIGAAIAAATKEK
jgi:NAD(P)-dependent dehydrogenase (short-subunit alcohol dehydrogenase family)